MNVFIIHLALNYRVQLVVPISVYGTLRVVICLPQAQPNLKIDR